MVEAFLKEARDDIAEPQSTTRCEKGGVSGCGGALAARLMQ
jgi:hypothetical protein